MQRAETTSDSSSALKNHHRKRRKGRAVEQVFEKGFRRFFFCAFLEKF
jgi:hypothetical protein